ncbi:hypothetical protein ARALYDRAFT_351553 [Arabidopsis lyrata subsp. lyrata]|uniref:Uncharacterized protein n=1 Tax=Arabidopsis lyrata subsp. lyrata TaxID=81972 RepID=D7M3Y4_ARALL|nr:hypothetical protein ARALYDRAFT_351553 [Arabidopsis lyrata subsp. lyrata]
MSTTIKITLVLNLLHLLFVAALVRSDQNTLPLRSFKISENAKYDCVDIFKQPGLNHPLLQNHTIQIAGVRSRAGPFHGVEAWYDGYALNVGRYQISYSQIFIGSRLNNQNNFIQAGYIINPGFFRTGQLWTYAFWKGKDGKGCYNTAFDGFIQVSRKFPIVQPIDLKPGVPDWSRWSIHQKLVAYSISNGPNEDIGYWSKELFNLIDNGATTVGVGGAVQASGSGESPPMGNGNFPVGGRLDSALVTNIEVLDSNYNNRKMNSFPTEIMVYSPKCYGVRLVR